MKQPVHKGHSIASYVVCVIFCVTMVTNVKEEQYPVDLKYFYFLKTDNMHEL